MNRISRLLAVLLTLVSLAVAQSATPQAPPPKSQHPHAMMDMHKQHMDGMKADLDKMKASLDQLKADITKITEPGEKARWQANVDLWTVMVGHMEQMSKHMDAMGHEGKMGSGMMHHGDMGGAPPSEAKPQ